MSIDANVIAAVITIVGGATVTYLKMIAQSIKNMEISVAVLAKRVEFIEERHTTIGATNHAPN